MYYIYISIWYIDSSFGFICCFAVHLSIGIGGLITISIFQRDLASEWCFGVLPGRSWTPGCSGSRWLSGALPQGLSTRVRLWGCLFRVPFQKRRCRVSKMPACSFVCLLIPSAVKSPFVFFKSAFLQLCLFFLFLVCFFACVCVCFFLLQPCPE